MAVRYAAVLWIRIRIGSDPHHFAESGSGSASRICQTGSGRSGSVSVPSTYVYYFFHENFNMLSEILKIITHLQLMRKEKNCKLALLWIKVKKLPLCFPTCVTYGVGFACGSALFWWQYGSRSASKQCQTTTCIKWYRYRIGEDLVYELIQWSKLVFSLFTTVQHLKMVIIVQVYVWGINSNYNLGLGHNSTRNNPELVEQFREAGQAPCFP